MLQLATSGNVRIAASLCLAVALAVGRVLFIYARPNSGSWLNSPAK